MVPARIAVVEDHEGLRRALSRLLEASGHELLCFASAEALLASEERRNVACLILDIRLPGLSGFELRERLAAEGSAAAAIYMTAHDDETSRQRAAREGAAYLVKPVAASTLLASVARALGRSGRP